MALVTLIGLVTLMTGTQPQAMPFFLGPDIMVFQEAAYRFSFKHLESKYLSMAFSTPELF